MPITATHNRIGLLMAMAGLAAVLTGCASSAPAHTSAPSDAEYTAEPSSAQQTARQLETAAERWIGTPYRYGGTSARGIDCSGLIQILYADALGLELPRTTRDQRRVGRSVAPQRWQPGDLLFFDTPGKARHAGIYLRDGRFVHASTSQGVMISDLAEPYWQRTYDQSRRILSDASSKTPPPQPQTVSPTGRSGW